MSRNEKAQQGLAPTPVPKHHGINESIGHLSDVIDRLERLEAELHGEPRGDEGTDQSTTAPLVPFLEQAPEKINFQADRIVGLEERLRAALLR